MALYLVGLSRPLSNYDEPIFAEFVRAMHEDGDYLTLRYQGAVTLQRPATSVILMAGASAAVGGEIGLRLVPALFTLISALLAGWVIMRLFDRWSAAVVAVALAAGVPSAFVYGRLALSDPPFVACVVAAVAAAVAAQRNPRYVLWSAGFLGAGVMFKSLAAAVPAVAVVPWLIVAWRHHGRAARPLASAGLGLALAAPFFAVGFIAHGAAFWHDHVAVMLLDRAAGDLEAVIGIGGPGAYLRHLWSADGPAAAVLLLGAPLGAAGLALFERDRELGVLASAALGTLLVLSLLGTRLAHYLLVFYPLAAMSAGALAARLLVRVPGRPRAYDALAITLAVTFVALGAVNQRFDYTAVPCVPCADLGRIADDRLDPDLPIYSLDWYAPALATYAGRPWRMLNTDPEVAKMIGGSDPFLQAGNIERAPPWPTWPLAIAGPVDRLERAGLLEFAVARSNDFVLVVIGEPDGEDERGGDRRDGTSRPGQ